MPCRRPPRCQFSALLTSLAAAASKGDPAANGTLRYCTSRGHATTPDYLPRVSSPLPMTHTTLVPGIVGPPRRPFTRFSAVGCCRPQAARGPATPPRRVKLLRPRCSSCLRSITMNPYLGLANGSWSYSPPSTLLLSQVVAYARLRRSSLWAVACRVLFSEAHMGKKLYVGNLTYGVSDSDLQQMFEPHGTVQSAQVIMDRDTGRSKGFGFVEMGTDEEAQAAIQALNGAEVGGRALTVNEARPKPEGGRGGGGFGGGGGGGGKGRGGYGGAGGGGSR